MFKHAAEIERQIHTRAIEGGRTQFIRARLLQGFVEWLAWSALMFVLKVFLFSWHEVVSISLVLFPLWMLGTYFHSRWRWNEMVRKQ